MSLFKKNDGRIAKCFAYVIVDSIGFYGIPVVTVRLVEEERQRVLLNCAIVYTVPKFEALTVRISLVKCTRRTCRRTVHLY